MIIRQVNHAGNGDDFAYHIEAVDARGAVKGECIVESGICERMYPLRPHQVRITFSGSEEAQASLSGAALAKAMEFARSEDLPARIYAPCDPDDKAMLGWLQEDFGFEDTEGLVQMRRELAYATEKAELPQDVYLRRESLENEPAVISFLQNYARLCGVDPISRDYEGWVKQLGLRRYSMEDRKGPMGEAYVSLKDGVGAVLNVRLAQGRNAAIGERIHEIAEEILAKVGAERILPRNPDIPKHVIVVRDCLEDANEAEYFLRRYNRLFGEANSISMVRSWAKDKTFRRYLMIDEKGLLGEILARLVPVDQHVEAEILFVQVNSSCCRRRLGSYLMQLAMHMLAREGAASVVCTVRVSINGIMRFMDFHEFEEDALIMRYPGMNWDPEAEQEKLRKRLKEQAAVDESDEWRTDLKRKAAEERITQDTSDWE